MKAVKRIAVVLALIVCVLAQSVAANAANSSVAVNGNQKIQITVKVVDENYAAIEDAEVSIQATDWSLFAKTPVLKLKAWTDSQGVATFKISSTYDVFNGYSVVKEGYEDVNAEKNVYIGLLNNKKSFVAKTSVKEYTVEFKDAAGKVIGNQVVKHGEAAEAPDVPEYNGASDYNMVFAGWDKDFSEVTENLTVSAMYEKAVSTGFHIAVFYVDLPEGFNKTTVPVTLQGIRYDDVFANVNITEGEDGFVTMYDGAKLTVESLFEDGHRAPLNTNEKYNPGRYFEGEGDDAILCAHRNDGITFKTPIANVDWYAIKRGEVSSKGNQTDSVIGKAVWTPWYDVTFYDCDGNVIETQSIKTGESAVAPENPAFTGESDYHMVFDAWDSSFENVTAPMEVHPTYKAEARKSYYTLYVNDPVSEKLVSLTKNGTDATDIFSSSKNVYEDEEGLVTLPDGSKVTIESLIDLEKVTRDSDPKGINQCGFTTKMVDGELVIFRTVGEEEFFVKFADINFIGFVRGAYFTFVQGQAEWTKQ